MKLRLNIDSTVSLAISLSGRLAIHSYNNFYAFPAATFFRRKLSCFVSHASLLKSNEHSKIELNLPGNAAWGAVKTAFEQVRVLNSARLWCWLRASFWTGRYPLSHCLIYTSAFCYSHPEKRAVDEKTRPVWSCFAISTVSRSAYVLCAAFAQRTFVMHMTSFRCSWLRISRTKNNYRILYLSR